ncbi:MAG: DUF4238 domain-containing protein [Prevotella sp.]|nr:DUF4238 domain-containing protein [Prevotella sp.]MCM1473385.1 DUF4238 domain-containing protein [Muribaculaceae bacterium]
MDDYIKSHVIIPASIMRGFFIKGKVKQTFVYEIGNNSDILSPRIKQYGNVYAYYEPQTETALGSIEASFGTVKNNIIKGLDDNKTYFLNDDERIITNLFLLTCFARFRKMAFLVQNASFFCSLLGIQLSPSDPVDNVLELYPKGELLDKFNISFLINNSSINLVCPENCLYSPLKHLEELSIKECILFPISPKYAIIISLQECNNIEIVNDEVIKSFNSDALLSVYTTSSTFVISSTEDELKELQALSVSKAFKNKVFLIMLYDKVKNSNNLHKDLNETEKDILIIYKDALPPQIKQKLIESKIIKP